MSTKKEREERLKKLETTISKEFGKESVFRLGSKEHVDFPHVPSNIPTIDKNIGIGGIPRGRIIELFGKESSGKTTLALYI